MCELMAMSFREPISADFSIREFAPRGEVNPDGWGLGWYPDRSLAMVKEPMKWGESRHAGLLEAHAHNESRIHIAHVREKTVGDVPSHADTHPFAREQGGRDYCFAHNGTLDERVWATRLDGHRPVGGTDSEHFFCHLLAETRGWAESLDDAPGWRRLAGFLGDANRMGKLNLLLSDGHRLFVYHDLGGWKGLHFRAVRIRDGEARQFGDDAISLGLDSDAANRGFVASTYPLSRTGWQPFHRGELIVFEAGSVVHSSHRDRHAPEFLGTGRALAPDRQEAAGCGRGGPTRVTPGRPERLPAQWPGARADRLRRPERTASGFPSRASTARRAGSPPSPRPHGRGRGGLPDRGSRRRGRPRPARSNGDQAPA